MLMRTRVTALLLLGILLIPACHGTLHSAARDGDVAKVRTLLDQGEPVDKLNMGGFTPLMYGIGHLDMTKVLLERGANPSFRTSQGVTPLHLAAEYGYADSVRALLEAGADPEPGSVKLGLGSDGTPLTIAQQKGSTRIVALLRDAIDKKTMAEKGGSSGEGQRPSSTALRTSDVDILPSARAVRKESAFAIVVGIEQYRQKLPKADHAVADAQTVTKYLTQVMGYPEDNVITLLNDHASNVDIVKYFEKWLPNNVEPGSTIFIYFSGHGAPNPATGDSYLVPYDGDPTYIAETGYSLKRLYDVLGKLQAKDVTVALDSCFSGAGGRSVLAKGARPLVMNLQTSYVPANVKVLAASSGEQISSTYDEKGHGLFTYFLLKGIKSENVVMQDGSLDVPSLYAYLKPQVSSIAKRKYNNEQTPQLITSKW